jgi:hypothetical protein
VAVKERCSWSRERSWGDKRRKRPEFVFLFIWLNESEVEDSSSDGSEEEGDDGDDEKNRVFENDGCNILLQLDDDFRCTRIRIRNRRPQRLGIIVLIIPVTSRTAVTVLYWT